MLYYLQLPIFTNITNNKFEKKTMTTFIKDHELSIKCVIGGNVLATNLGEYNNVITAVGTNPVNIYLYKVNNKDTRKRCEICSMLAIKTPEKLIPSKTDCEISGSNLDNRCRIVKNVLLIFVTSLSDVFSHGSKEPPEK